MPRAMANSPKPRKRSRAINGATPRSSCGDDIEDLPQGLREAYQHHQLGYHRFSELEVACIRHGLLDWYEKNRRKLPWRGDPPPWTRSADASGLQEKSRGRKGAGATDAKQRRLTAFFGHGEKSKRGTDITVGSSRAGEGTATERKDKDGGKAEYDPNGALVHSQDQAGRIPMSAYGTWVSEVMLQQTRVETVVGYYVTWMTLFPTSKALADADLEQVNKVWAGLGYYRRAKMLHEGAKKVQSEHGGSLPGSAKELLKIPGIGPYTAGAVASIAFGEREPLVDGNVIRVLSRLRAVASDPKNAALNKLCWELAGSLVDPSKPGDFNQALMELGATVCTVKNPACSTCPIRGSCLARKLSTGAETGDSPRAKSLISGRCDCTVCELEGYGIAALPLAVTEFPRKAAKTAVKDQVLSVTVVEREDKNDRQVLLVKRPDKGLLAGQWECPSVVLRESETARSGIANFGVPENERRKAADSLLFSTLKLDRDLVKSRMRVGSLVHVFSHMKHHMQVEHLCLNDDPHTDNRVQASLEKEVRWVDSSDMGGLGITTGMQKVIALATKDHGKE